MNERDELEPVAAEFASYRHAAREAFPPEPAGAVFATARTRAVRRRAAVLSVVAATVVALLLTGAAMVQTSATPQPVPPASAPASIAPTPPTPAPTPATPEPIDEHAQPPADWQDRGNQVQFLDEQTAQRVREASLSLPEWPGTSSDLCPAGEYTFTRGQSQFEGSDGNPWTYRVLVPGQHGVVADADGVAGDEILVPIGCGPLYSELRFGLLALAPGGSGFRPMGYVMAASDGHGGPDRFFPDGDDIVVEVLHSDLAAESEQRRRYRWQGSRFVQVGGPTSMPGRPTNPTQSFPVRITGENDPCGTGGTLSFENGTSGVWAYESEQDGVSFPAAEYLIGDVSSGDLAGDQVVLATLTCRNPDGFTETWVHHVGAEPLPLRTGTDGVTRIVSHRIVDGLAEVTVRVEDGGEQTRRYRTDGFTWEPAA